ncbi:MAG: FMN-binding protein [Bacteroidales bacterium]|nr:FMN-binding protein [Bacteroidales bacterium]
MKQKFLFFVLVYCLLTVIAVSAVKKNNSEIFQPVSDTTKVLKDGTIVINTTGLGKDIQGFAGITPLEIYIKNGVVDSIIALKNQETPGYMRKAGKILNSWNGKTIDQALKLEVDAVTGATFSSNAIKSNVKVGLDYAKKNKKFFIKK